MLLAQSDRDVVSSHNHDSLPEQSSLCNMASISRKVKDEETEAELVLKLKDLVASHSSVLAEKTA